MSPSGSLPGGWFVSDSARRDVALKSRWQTRAVENSRFHACQDFRLFTFGFDFVFCFLRVCFGSDLLGPVQMSYSCAPRFVRIVNQLSSIVATRCRRLRIGFRCTTVLHTPAKQAHSFSGCRQPGQLHTLPRCAQRSSRVVVSNAAVFYDLPDSLCFDSRAHIHC